jgi:hypothetical protein
MKALAQGIKDGLQPSASGGGFRWQLIGGQRCAFERVRLDIVQTTVLI